MLDPINRLDFFKTTVAFYAILYQNQMRKKCFNCFSIEMIFHG